MGMIKSFFFHLRTVARHRFWVRHYCFMASLYWQGLTHDLSKYSPTEFFESVHYYQGNRSPIDACKEAKGYSMAWFHHRGRNRHHWEYWVDNFQDGMTPVEMPFRYAVEMFCDFLAAGHTYMGGAFNTESEAAWWRSKRKKVVMHPTTKRFIDLCFLRAHEKGLAWVLNKSILAAIYRDAISETKENRPC